MLRRLILFSAVVASLAAALPGLASETALDRYVKKPDPSYSFHVVNTLHGEGYTAFIVDLTSQTWRTEKDVDRTV